MFRVAAVVVVLTVCASLSGCGSSSRSSVIPSPKSALASVVAAARAQTSVHWTSNSYAEFGGVWTDTADVNANSGMDRQVSSVFGTAWIRLVQNTVYVRGSARQLIEMTGLNEAEARRYAGRWISIPRRDREYGHIADGLTLASTVHDVTCGGYRGTKLTIVKRKSRAERLRRFRWVYPADWEPCRLNARASGLPLPVSFRFAGPGRGYSLHLSRWNEALHVEAPTGATPIATVRRS